MWNPFKPKIENSDPGQRSLQLISQKGMPFAYVEAYKSLRTNLNFLTSSTGARAIVVTSTMPEEAKSNVSVNLALTLAEDGKNVALVDCDLRKPVLHKYLKAGHNVKGVSNIVSNQCKLEEALQIHLVGARACALHGHPLPGQAPAPDGGGHPDAAEDSGH